MSTQTPPKSLLSEILARIIGPEEADLNPEAARAILKWNLDDRDRERSHQLSAKNQAGLLSSDELEELETYRRVGRLVSLLHAKARRSLKQAGVDSATRPDE